MIRFCRDCLHYVGKLQGPVEEWYEACKRPREPVFNLVDGKKPLLPELKPRAERYSKDPKACGAEGQFYFPRVPEEPKPVIAMFAP